MDILFPHDTIRESQIELIKDINNAITNKNSIIAHAPTGLGKTAASLAPAITHAIKNDLTVFFLTSRHTQHLIAIETLRKIQDKHGKNIIATDIIGKKWMCLVPGVDMFKSFEFSEYCKKQREEGKCEFYNNTIKRSGSLTIKTEHIISHLQSLPPMHTEKLIDICNQEKLCPYEVAALLSKKANVIITDYNYIFNQSIRTLFFRKTQKQLGKSIIIIDEGHNLPDRIRSMQSQILSTFILSRAIKEAEKFEFTETASILKSLMDILIQLKADMNYPEVLLPKEDFLEEVEKIKPIDDIIADLELVAADIREQQKRSYIGSIAQFLIEWQGEDEGYVRILSATTNKFGEQISLSYKCLDPSVITKEVITAAYSVILMSGTLNPPSMYKDILGFPEKSLEKIYESPFPDKNKLALVVPETTTKFTQRNEDQFKRIAEITAEITNEVPGNTAIFFPSYFLRDKVNNYFQFLAKKTTIIEQPGLTKEEKIQVLERFKDFKAVGAVLLGVYAGSFGEGVDLPGDLLKAVIVVGLPLNKPDLETKQLINYYQEWFGKGWDYGYLFPAMNKCFQSAGRCIRTETDRGVVIFLDERFTWPMYFRTFPQDWEIKIGKNYKERIKEFFSI